MLARPGGPMIQSRFVFYLATGCLLFSHCYTLHEISLLAEGEHIIARRQEHRISAAQGRNYLTVNKQPLIKSIR